MQRLKTDALILRTTSFRDHDLVLDVLGQTTGRFSALARGARKSRRRFGGALEIGTQIVAEVQRRSTGMAVLSECEIRVPLQRIRTDLDAINQLSYVLEITRLCAREGVRDDNGYRLVVGYVNALEQAPPTHEALAVWELTLLALLGHRLTLDRCAVSGGPANGLSARMGGAVDRRRVPEAAAVDPEGLQTLRRLLSGDHTAQFSADGCRQVRKAMAHVWREVTGHVLRTAPYLLTP